jgi:hypothetical protein
MRSTQLFAVTILLAGTFALAAAKPQSFTGKVSDAMCGANHMMSGEASECVQSTL